MIDASDAHWIGKWNWCVRIDRRRGDNSAVYAARREILALDNQTIVMMHQAILGPGADHANGDGLDNRKQNLRLATPAQNSWNRRRPITNRSGFKGVYFRAERRTWLACIRANGTTLKLGTYRTKEEAARAYDAAARQYHGEFARLNFPDAAGAWNEGR